MSFSASAASSLPYETSLGETLDSISTINSTLRETCVSKIGNVSKRYDATAVQMSTASGFNLSMRNACLQALINENIMSIIEKLSEKSLISKGSILPLQIQILKNGAKVDIFSEDVRARTSA